MIISFSSASDIIVSTNLTKSIIINVLLPAFEIEWAKTNYGSPFLNKQKRKGRQPLLSSIDLIGLVLWYLKTKDFIYRMCPIFGLVPSTVSIWLKHALAVLYKVVSSRLFDCQFKWSSPEEIHSSASLLERNRSNGHLLTGIFGVMDGGRMPTVSYLLGRLYSRQWSHKPFCMGFCGLLIHDAVNFPGVGMIHAFRILPAYTELC